MEKARVKFWGVRGSMAVPGKGSLKTGGNTSCVQISVGKEEILCDAGTGIRSLGNRLIRQKAGKTIKASILLSHVHWDHYIGLPFFKPLYDKRNKFLIAGPKPEGSKFGDAIRRAMHPPYFPIPVGAIPAKISFRTLSEEKFKLGDVEVIPHRVNHPGGAFGWRFNFASGRSLVHITDNEPSASVDDERVISWMKDADVLIHDAQYTPDEYKRRIGWGHSPFTFPVELASAAAIKRLYLFHFDPDANDAALERMLLRARKFSRRRSGGPTIDLAREGKGFSL